MSDLFHINNKQKYKAILNSAFKRISTHAIHYQHAFFNMCTLIILLLSNSIQIDTKQHTYTYNTEHAIYAINTAYGNSFGNCYLVYVVKLYICEHNYILKTLFGHA